MIFYFVLLSMLAAPLVFSLLRMHFVFFYVQSLFWIFGFVGLVSVFYLEFKPIFITEQLVYSHFNGSSIVLLLLFYLHMCGVYFYNTFSQRKIKSIFNMSSAFSLHVNSKTRFFLRLICVFLIVVLYLNLLLSDTPPLLGDGYVDRFQYIEGTRFWWLLSPFGVVTIPLPILLGWLLFISEKKTLIIFISFLYSVYLALIGQKFGGFVLSCFLLSLPTICRRAIGYRLFDVFLRLCMLAGIFFVFSLSIVFYHYSNYSMADDFGGALSLIEYRIFGLQGHTFWGAFNHFISDFRIMPNFYGLVDGMHNVMRLISPALADQMIDRGVNFSFGYFASLLVNLGVLAFPFAVLLGLLHAYLSVIVVSAVLMGDFFSYFVIINIFVAFNNYISMGSLSYLLNYKIFLLIFTFLVYNLCIYISDKSNRNPHFYVKKL